MIKDIKTILEQKGLTTKINLSKVLEEESISIFSTAGYAKSASGNGIEEPTFQVWVRSKSYLTAEALANKVKNILHGLSEIKVENNRYLAIYHQSGPLDLGESENGWKDISVNFRCYLESEYITHFVERAEELCTQDSINKARTLVLGLSDGITKTELNARLDDVQATIDLSEQIALATDLVEIAELSQVQDDIDDAWAVVNTLAIGSEIQVQLIDRLNAVQAEINVAKEIQDATGAVETAENTEQQSSVDYARVLVNRIPDSKVEKAELTARLDEVQLIIDNQVQFDTADIAVSQAEGTLMQSAVDSARILVNTLPEVALKQIMIERLDGVQYQIDLIVAIEEAEIFVDAAELSLNQVDVNLAWDKVNMLQPGAAKTNFVNRLNNAQYAINLNILISDAVNKTELAETTKLQADIDIARSRVANIPEGNSHKTSLTTRLDVVQAELNIINATNAVVTAETSKAQADVTTARTLVDALPISDTKTSLTARLDAVQSFINDNNAMTAVQNAENLHTQQAVSDAWVYVNILQIGSLKTELTYRLNAVQDDIAILTATYAVEQAEASKLQADVDSARILVNNLTSAYAKDSLNARLDIVQNIINSASKLNILVDFGDVAKMMVSPDANGKTWNNVTTMTQGYTSPVLKHSSGVDTNVTLNISKSFYATDTGVNAVYPTNASTDGFRTDSLAPSYGQITINNLKAYTAYRFTFYSSSTSASRSTIFKIGAQQVSVVSSNNTATVYLDVSTNDVTSVTIEVNHPNTATRGIINVLEIQEL